MKLSTRILKYTQADVEIKDGYSYINMGIKMMVDCGKNKDFEIMRPCNLECADACHKELLEKGCTLLLAELCVNPWEVVIHYTSTTYKDWCEA